MKRLISWLLVIGCAGWGGAPAEAAKRLNVVATLSTFADLVRTIGAEHVDVASVASPQFNPHFIEPKPSDVLKVKRADLFLHAGLDLELWRGPLLDAAGNTALFQGGPGELDLSQGIALLEVPGRAVSRAEGDIHLYGNPHYWVDPENAELMATLIADKLSAVDPAHAEDYRRNLHAFVARLKDQMQVWRAQLAPYRGQELVGYHNEWPYFMRFAGLRMEQFLEPKPGIPPTPQHVEFLQRYMKEHRVRAIAQAPFYPARAAKTLVQQTGAHLVLLCQNVGEVPEASDYVAMIDYNVRQLVKGLQP